ncbi:MAG: sugar phosphate isomerase/epimerase [Clostridia bacterium]|nr:sugar phosphate isomerase/epimerase [Clostridia bacterium]
MNIGIQLYSVREEIAKEGLESVLAKIAKAGYDSVEFAGFYGLTPTQMKELLAKYGLKPLSAHIGVNDIEGNLPYIDELGIKFVFIPWNNYEGLSGQNYVDFCNALHKAKKLLDSRGVVFGYHNHAHEYEHGADKVYDLITDIDGFTAELDIFWAVAGGHEPTSLMSKYGDALVALHIKDMDKRANPTNPREYPNAIVGEGQCNAEKAMKFALGQGVENFILEVEGYPCDYEEYLVKSCENIKKFAQN